MLVNDWVVESQLARHLLQSRRVEQVDDLAYNTMRMAQTQAPGRTTEQSFSSGSHKNVDPVKD
jgi:hypothetical protein